MITFRGGLKSSDLRVLLSLQDHCLWNCMAVRRMGEHIIRACQACIIAGRAPHETCSKHCFAVDMAVPDPARSYDVHPMNNLGKINHCVKISL